MSRATLSSFTSLLSALFVVVALMFAGCTADSLTGPDPGPEIIVQSNGDHNITNGDHNAANGDHNATNGDHNATNGDHNKSANGDHNKSANGDHN